MFFYCYFICKSLLVPTIEAKPTQEELVEKDKLYEFKIGAKGKSKDKKESEDENMEVVEEERREGGR